DRLGLDHAHSALDHPLLRWTREAGTTGKSSARLDSFVYSQGQVGCNRRGCSCCCCGCCSRLLMRVRSCCRCSKCSCCCHRRQRTAIAP
ncbi:hypothetical protein PMAYCL1PPCAC_14015, partial [Pristionchus mayeri]